MNPQISISKWDWFWATLTGIAILVALYMAFILAPIERTMGLIQKIFYFHVASAWLSFFAFFIVFLASIIYLAKKTRHWDIIGYSSAQIGVIFCTIVLVTGPIWGRPVWGIWWTWDARLTSTLVLWLIYIAYLMLRSYIYEPNRKATLSAVLGIIGFLDVPFVYFSIRWWRTQHPQPVIAGGEKSGLAPEMLAALIVSVIAFTILYIFLMRQIVQLEKVQDDLDHLHKSLHMAS